jgi:GNAT superfamily N-acetyltransferase
MLEIVTAETGSHYRQVEALMVEYRAWDSEQTRLAGLDPQAMLDFYCASGEESLPGAFTPPAGRLLLATDVGQTAGCVGFHRMTPDICEMKRMYVRPEFRGMRVGRQLAEALILAARESGYGLMRLETTAN